MAPTGKTGYVMDGNAVMRNYASISATVPRPATFLATIVLKSIPVSLNKRYVAVLFDDSKRMMPQRAELHAKRYKNVTTPSAAATAEVAKAQAYQLAKPLRFPLLFETSPGKARAYALLAQAVFVQLSAAYGHKGLAGFTVGFPDGTIRGHGEQPKELCRWQVTRWGEADQKCYEAASALAKSGWEPVVVTVDTDMILQSIARWRTPGPKRVCLKKETVSVPKLLEQFLAPGPPEQASVRLSAAFILIAAYGCDYSSALSAYGYRKLPLARLAQTMRAMPLEKLPMTWRKECPTLQIGTTLYVQVDERTAVNSTGSRSLRKEGDEWVGYLFKEFKTRRTKLKRQPEEGSPATNVHLIHLSALRRILATTKQVRKAKGPDGKGITPHKVYTASLKAVWATVYFSGESSGNPEYGGPNAIAEPPPAATAAFVRWKAPFVAHVSKPAYKRSK